ncbi:MAG: carboxypeptidase regulatory-like domain-containing protein [Bacteroidota bacterium]
MKVFINTMLVMLLVTFATNTTLAQRKANKQYELKAFNLAISSYLKYINQNPSSGEAMANLADCYRHINQMQEALEWYERAFSAPQLVDPKHYFNYGKVLMSLGRYEEAARQFRRYERVNSDEGTHFYEMAVYASRNSRLRSKFAVTPVEGLNTAASDFSPAFFRNDQLVYSSARTDAGSSGSNWTGKAKNQLFLSEYRPQSGTLEPVKILDQNNNNRFSVGPVSYSADGRMAAITHNNFIDGTRHISSSGMKLDLYVGQAGFDGNWREEEEFPWNSAQFSTGFAQIAADGNTMYFASDRPGGQGGFDIYVSYKTGSSWSTPENLGPNINTPGDEITPYFDGRTLYFASNWHDGYGGYDVFRSDRNNQQWSVARNMGVGINSPRDDYGFIFDGVRNEGYFTSNREGSQGSEDIYKISRQTNEVALRILNASDRRPIPDAILDFSDCQRGVFETDANGSFNFRADEELNCRVIVRKAGYSSSSLQLSAMSIRNNQNYEVVLSREGEQYRGMVYDTDTRAEVPDVRIQAIDQATGQIAAETMTDELGEYILPLSPQRTYMLRFSKMGYTDLSKNIATGDGYNRNILGAMPFRRVNSTTQLPDDVRPTDPNDINRPNNRNQGRAVSLSELPADSYSVQVAATNKVNLNNYASLNVHGNVYYKLIKNVYKVRVGAYTDRAAAADILKKVKREGYKDAFLVKESTMDVQDKLILEDGTYLSTSTPTNNNNDSDVGANKGTMNGYKVQLAAYRNPQYFDGSKVDNLGYIESKRKGEWTVMFISGFSDAYEAKRAMQQAKSAGFPSAFVVVEENGELKRVKI